MPFTCRGVANLIPQKCVSDFWLISPSTPRFSRRSAGNEHTHHRTTHAAQTSFAPPPGPIPFPLSPQRAANFCPTTRSQQIETQHRTPPLLNGYGPNPPIPSPRKVPCHRTAASRSGRCSWRRRKRYRDRRQRELPPRYYVSRVCFGSLANGHMSTGTASTAAGSATTAVESRCV